MKLHKNAFKLKKKIAMVFKDLRGCVAVCVNTFPNEKYYI
jgi:hypothetical protein